MKLVKLLEESGSLVKGINETIKNETKEQIGGFLPMLLGTLAASLLGSALTLLGPQAPCNSFLRFFSDSFVFDINYEKL